MMEFCGRRPAAFILAGVLCLGGLSGCGTKCYTGPGSSGGSVSSAGSTTSGDISSAGDSSGSNGASSSIREDPSSSGGESDQSELPLVNLPQGPVPVPAGADFSSYDFAQPAPASPAVENTYFADAAFVGDSRTEGFFVYSGVGNGDKLTSNGLSIFKLAEKKALTIDETDYTLLEALSLKEYSKVYLCLGVNELGYKNDQGFYDNYCAAIDAIRFIQPNAVIYVQSLIPLNEGVIAKNGGASYLTNAHLRVYNDLIRQVAQEKKVVFLDLYSEFADGNGELPADASSDGVHLRSSWCKQWLEYLKNHTVTYDQLYTSAAPQPGRADLEVTNDGEGVNT